jgi:hypothetical protein
MYEGRDLRKEVNELGIVTMEDFGLGSRESAFAALDAIREHNRQFPEEKLLEMNQAAIREANASMSGTKNSKGGD